MYSEIGKERKIVMELTREGLRAAGIQDAQIDEILAARGQEIASALQREQDLKNQLDSLNVKVKTVDDLTAKVRELEQKNMTAEELQAQKIKDAEEAKTKYSILSNKLEAQRTLTNAGIMAGETLNAIVDRISTPDLDATLKNAKVIIDMVNATKVATEQEVKASLLANNPKPNPSNDPNDTNAMTKEKFDKLSYEEMADFANAHPDEFARM